jgi:hypothetical protein
VVSPDTEFTPVGDCTKIKYKDDFKTYKKILIQGKNSKSIRALFDWYNTTLLDSHARMHSHMMMGVMMTETRFRMLWIIWIVLMMMKSQLPEIIAGLSRWLTSIRSVMSSIAPCSRIFAFSHYYWTIPGLHHMSLMSPDLVRPFLALSDDFRSFPMNFAFGRRFATSHVRSRPVTTATRHCTAPQKLPACRHVKSRKDAESRRNCVGTAFRTYRKGHMIT